MKKSPTRSKIKMSPGQISVLQAMSKTKWMTLDKIQAIEPLATGGRITRLKDLGYIEKTEKAINRHKYGWRLIYGPSEIQNVTTRARVLAVLTDEWQFTSEIREQVGISRTQANQALNGLYCETGATRRNPVGNRSQWRLK